MLLSLRRWCGDSPSAVADAGAVTVAGEVDKDVRRRVEREDRATAATTPDADEAEVLPEAADDDDDKEEEEESDDSSEEDEAAGETDESDAPQSVVAVVAVVCAAAGCVKVVAGRR